MVLGAGRPIVPSILSLKTAGFRCLVIDDLPQPFAFEVADLSFRCALTDGEGLAEIVRDVGEIDGAVATNEAGISAIATLHAHGRLQRGPTSELATRLASKWRQREAINRSCLEWSVPFQIVSSVSEVLRAGESLGWPLILKPDLTAGGSRGVSLVASADETEAAFAFAYAQANGSAILAEQALDGPQFSAELLVAEGRTEVIAVGRKRKSRSPYRVDLAVIYPGLEPGPRAEAERMLREVVAALEVRDSAVHIEFAMTSRGPRPIEVGARVGGGFTSRLVSHSTGCDPFVQAARIACGLPVEWPPEARSEKGAVYGFLTYPPGEIVGQTVPAHVVDDPRVLDVFVLPPADGRVRPLQWTSQRVGMMAVTGETSTEALSTFERLSRSLTLTYADGVSRPPLVDNAE